MTDRTSVRTKPICSLRLKALLASALVLVGMATVLGLRVQSIDLEQRLLTHQRRVDHEVESLADALGESFDPLDISEMSRLLNRLADDEGILFYAVYNAQRDYIVHGFGPEFYERASAQGIHIADSTLGTEPLGGESEPAQSAQLGGALKRLKNDLSRFGQPNSQVMFDPSIVGDTVLFDRRPVMIQFKGVTGPGRGVKHRVGEVIIAHDPSHVRLPHAKVRARIWMTIALVTFFTATVVWILTHFMIRPVFRVIEATQRIASDKFDKPIKVRSGDELEMLAHSVNQMADKLQRSRREVEHINRELEQLVEQRTEQLATALDDLTVLDKMKDGFLATISHEIRTPITSIKAFAEILSEMDDISDADRREFLNIILGQSSRLEVLVGKILDLVRLESGEMPFEYVHCSPQDPLKEALNKVWELARDKQILMCIDHDKALPSVFWDSTMISRVLQEVLTNAIQWSPENGHLHVAVNPMDDGNLLFTVRDEGPGIPDAELESIFMKFKQVGDALTDKPQGTGLGLPVCREIVQAHDGTIRAEAPSDGPGALLSIVLPPIPKAADVTAVEPMEATEAREVES